MYSIEYRRFYLHDLESIVVWPSNAWVWRLIVPGLLFVLLGYAFWQWVNSTTGAIVGSIGLAWIALELVLGPTAKSRICTSGASVDLPLVQRTRRAHKVLAKIDAAVRAVRGATAQPSAPLISPQPAEPSVQSTSGDSAAPAIVDATQTNES
jgi:hypothetical protein